MSTGVERMAHDEVRRIFRHALHASSIAAAFDRLDPLSRLPLADSHNIYAIAIGKAALPMLAIFNDRLPRRLAGGICCAPVLPAKRIRNVEYFRGGHPLPNEDSFASARAILHLLHSLTSGDSVFFLISGGGSAMCELPLDENISLEDTRTLYQALVGCGGTIAEINTVRKHFSAIKGGRLDQACGPARRFSLLVADVAPRYLDALASGPTLPDASTVADCREILARYHLLQNFPPAVRTFFAGEGLPETPKAGEMTSVASETLLSSDDLAAAARVRAIELGYEVVTDNHCDDWDYDAAAAYLLQRFRALQGAERRLCLLSAGEVTVRLGQDPGQGGRNQQFALACALKGLEGMVVLSAGSDGIDGNSPAAGAIADAGTVERAGALGMDAHEALQRFDAYPLFAALGDGLVTGPTHNNLRDLRILLSC